MQTNLLILGKFQIILQMMILFCSFLFLALDSP